MMPWDEPVHPINTLTDVSFVQSRGALVSYDVRGIVVGSCAVLRLAAPGTNSHASGRPIRGPRARNVDVVDISLIIVVARRAPCHGMLLFSHSLGCYSFYNINNFCDLQPICGELALPR